MTDTVYVLVIFESKAALCFPILRRLVSYIVAIVTRFIFAETFVAVVACCMVCGGLGQYVSWAWGLVRRRKWAWCMIIIYDI